MRLLLTLTLTCFFILFTYKSDAAPVSEKARAATFIHSLSETGNVDYPEYDIHTATIFHFHNIRKSSNHHRSVRDILMDFSGQSTPVEILPGAGSVEQTRLHYTPIALKLIFPKHYFW